MFKANGPDSSVIDDLNEAQQGNPLERMILRKTPPGMGIGHLVVSEDFIGVISINKIYVKRDCDFESPECFLQSQ
jgi:hypothetical protein